MSETYFCGSSTAEAERGGVSRILRLPIRCVGGDRAAFCRGTCFWDGDGSWRLHGGNNSPVGVGGRDVSTTKSEPVKRPEGR